jgi:predicted ribosomally synthesized peptide with SipW-like signal peptide
MGGERAPRHWLSVRLRVLLAGGLVLGMGAMMTLASWHDADLSTGSFAASTFATESNVNGAGYATNTASPGPTVTFAGAGFTPGVSRYLSVLIRTTATSVGGTVMLGGATLSGTDAATLGAAFRYKVVRTSGTCDATAFTIGSPSFVVGTFTADDPLNNGQEVGVTNILAGATATLPGIATGFCFAITLPANADNGLQGNTATATWQFGAISHG